jgi:hypothetical protein
MTEPAVTPEPADSPTATDAGVPDADVQVEGPSEAIRALREKYPEPPRAGSLKKLAPGQGLALIGIVCCAWTPFILWWAFGPAALVLGFLAYRKGEKRAKWLMLAAVLAMAGGVVMNNLPDKFVSN